MGTEENGEEIVYVGSKEVMNYVLAVVTQMNEDSDQVTLKARGNAISRAVDAAEIVRNRFLPELNINDIETGTEEIEDEDGSSNVSTISIELGQ